MKRKNFQGRRDARRAEATERQEAWGKLSPKQQLKRLDKRLGQGQGAKRQRAKLQEQLNEEVV